MVLRINTYTAALAAFIEVQIANRPRTDQTNARHAPKLKIGETRPLPIFDSLSPDFHHIKFYLLIKFYNGR
jgi:hypothetical protein